ncbi:hypothetical protein BaRGS_00016582 [Batillaria attramentaria]|uniref:Uncharacterized protein n=1 Tax=Batillaria attramentaria TaxID=370345 RepID=A0ABD0KYT0_9CAEN
MPMCEDGRNWRFAGALHSKLHWNIDAVVTFVVFTFSEGQGAKTDEIGAREIVAWVMVALLALALCICGFLWLAYRRGVFKKRPSPAEARAAARSMIASHRRSGSNGEIRLKPATAAATEFLLSDSASEVFHILPFSPPSSGTKDLRC